MHPDIPATLNTEEPSPDFDHRRNIYAPFMWLAVWIIRAGQRAGFISPEFLMSPRPKISANPYHRNRQLRRARASCLRRARRCQAKGGRINPEDYTPRAYAHFGYVAIMDKTLTPSQFLERYARDSRTSRVQIYGMDSAHHICGFMGRIAKILQEVASSSAAFIGLAGLNFAAPADPAPP